MRRSYSTVFFTNCLVAMVVAIGFGQPAQAISIQIDGTPLVFAPNAAGGGTTVLPFAGINHVGGENWDISAGEVILNVVPGPGATTSFANLTLTGFTDPNTGVTTPLVFTYDPGGAAGGNAVSIAFSSAPGLGLNGFNPINPAFDGASLNGAYASPTAVNLAVGPKLVASAFGAGQFGVIGPLGPAPGVFVGAIAPIRDPAPPVVNLSGVFSFTFSANQVAGDTVVLPNSAEVDSQTPEPGAFWLLVSGFAVLAGYGLQRRKRGTRL